MADSADRWYIYDFIERSGEIKNKVLVVSNQDRAQNKIVSIIMLGSSMLGHDVVPIKIEGQEWAVNCGLVTFCARDRLGRKHGKIPDKKARAIEDMIAQELGLVINERVDYKTLYESLIDKLI